MGLAAMAARYQRGGYRPPITEYWDEERGAWFEVRGTERVEMQVLKGIDYTDMLRKQREAYGKLRGWSPGTGKYIVPAKNFPKTTNGDVIELLRYWDRAFATRRYKQSTRDVHGAAARERYDQDRAWEKLRRWLAGLSAVVGDPRFLNREFDHNERLWDALRELARHLTTMQSEPSAYKLFKEASSEAVEDFKRRAKSLLSTIPWKKIGLVLGLVGAGYVALRIAELRKEAR